MESKQLYDITDVCRILGTTSRTLRFYEEKGIITSTTIGLSSRRQYTEEQIAHIRNVLVLRTLGLSIKSIADLQADRADLKDAVLSKRAEIYASIDTRLQEINLLNEALFALESGRNIFDESWHDMPKANTDELEVVLLCTKAILNGEDDVLFRHISPRLAHYMPTEVYRTVRKDTFTPLGELVTLDRIVTDKKIPIKYTAQSVFQSSVSGSHSSFMAERSTVFGLATMIRMKESVDGMKKKWYVLCVLLCILTMLLSSCKVNWFDKQYDVAWWVIAIPVTIWSLAWLIGGSCYIASKKYVCPTCTRSFSPKWYRAMFSIHMNDDRLFRCPYCGKRSFCRLDRGPKD